MKVKRAEEENEAAVGERHAYDKGVKYLSENGLKVLPEKYVLPLHERPREKEGNLHSDRPEQSISLPTVDFRELQGPNRRRVIESIAEACEKHGFFQVVNHGIPMEVLKDIIDVSARFFEQPFEERAKYMSPDMFSPVRYGTSMNHKKDSVLCWRDFLKITCPPTLSEVSLRHLPSSPADFRKSASTYARETKYLFSVLMKAVLEGLLMLHKSNKRVPPGGSIVGYDAIHHEVDNAMEMFKGGSQLMVMNCYPPCPQPNLTLGMPPHSDYGFLTFLLQDEVKGLQVQFEEKWFTIDPVPGSFSVNIGDHLEIFSNGRYKSVLHRVLANSARSRVSVVSIHSFPFEATVRPWEAPVDEANPRRYGDTSLHASLIIYLLASQRRRISWNRGNCPCEIKKNIC